ncbi:MAG: hypothetical protein EAY75_15030 [Bacteroidetes bacterium]|nr:MAG: hypothetical protein EAY75_15030 [Bacteroidota bacterium]
MDKRYKLIDALKQAVLPPETVPLLAAEVVAINGDHCTVMYNGMELSQVRLKATIGTNANQLLVEPKVGSMVLLGSLTNDLKDLVVLVVDEVQKLTYAQGGLQVVIDGAAAKVELSNSNTGVAQLLTDLVALLRGLKLYTPAGPSGTILPDTQLALTQFETDFKTLFN